MDKRARTLLVLRRLHWDDRVDSWQVGRSSRHENRCQRSFTMVASAVVFETAGSEGVHLEMFGLLHDYQCSPRAVFDRFSSSPTRVGGGQ